MKVKCVKNLTKTKSLFKDMKSSYCLTFFKASMSLGSRKGRFRASATYWTLPL